MEAVKYLLLQDEGVVRGEVVAPQKIRLDQCKIILGKGSPKLPVDIVISALKNDKEIISRRHAEMLMLDNGECIINDLGALNGIFVNNIKVNSHKLADGDIIQFGGLCNQAVGTSLDKSDVALRYMFRSENTCDDAKRKSPDSLDSKAPSSGGKRSKVAVDSLHNIVSPPFANNKFSSDGATSVDNDIGALERLKAELKRAQKTFSIQLERLKQEGLSTEAALNKEIANLRAQSAVQIEAIDARDASLKSTRLHSKQLEEQLRSLELKIAATERQLAEKAQKSQALQVQLESVNAREKSAPAQCGISNSTLEASISCPLCEQLLVEAVVLQCSHGYCRACIEQHWYTAARAKSRSPTSSSTVLSMTCRCPRCNAISTRDRKTTRSSKAGNSACYVRSDHLDALTWLFIEAGSATARQKYELREAQHRKDLQSLGIDPDLVPSNDPRDEPEADAIAPDSSKKPSTARDNTNKAIPAEKHAFCDYCGGSGHPEEECPHRMDEVAESSSEDDGSNMNSDNDEDM